jgi:O-antigen ligase
MTTRTVSVARGGRTAPMAATAVGALVVSVAVGVALAVQPMLALLPIGALASAFLLIDGRARIVLLLGGLFILQRGEELDMSKVAFLGLFSVAFAGALLNLRTMKGSPAYQLARPLLAASVAFCVLAALSLAVAHNNAIPLVGGWLRDLAPYLLFAAAPVFALDAQASLPRKRLVALLVCAGLIGAFAFAADWLERRGIGHLGASNVGLATYLLPAALFSYGMSAALHARQGKWLVASALVLALLLISGTRTNLVLLVAPIAIAFATRRERATRFVRLAFLAPVAAALTVAVGLAIVTLSNLNTQALTERLALLVSSGGSSDYSYIERKRETRAASKVFKSNVVVGSGPGTAFDWERADGTEVSSFTLDTPLTFPAKFGLVGLAALAFAITRYWSFVRALFRSRRVTIGSLALVGYLAVAAFSIPASSPFEEKGFSFGLVLLLALTLSEANERSTRSSSPGLPLPNADVA